MNKLAAKQEAFEEANRLKNQFRALDEDEVEFLDSVLESTRAEEDRVKRETAEGLALFRKQQEEADKKARRASDGAADAEEGLAEIEEESWVSGGRKRKRVKDKEVIKGVKLRRSSTAGSSQKPAQASPPAECHKGSKGADAEEKSPEISSKTEASSNSKAMATPAKLGLGLVDYGSDEDGD